jgi:cytochrome c-type biogenesis protein CcmH/NrfG
MVSSRNIHFAILGIILGASTGYVFAFYNAQKAQTPPALTESQAESQVPAGHPEVNNESMLAAMKTAVEKDPSQPEVLIRYAMALFDAGHFTESEEWFKKTVDLAPDNIEARSMYGAVLWRTGKKDAAEVQLEAALKIDPKNIASLHGLVLLNLEKKNYTKAEQLIKQIEGVDPAYAQLGDLKSRLKTQRGGD